MSTKTVRRRKTNTTAKKVAKEKAARKARDNALTAAMRRKGRNL